MQSSISLCDLPWWAVLLSWLVPAILGYLWGMLQWGRFQSRSKKAEMELSSASKRIVNLEKEVNECRMAYDKVNREKEKLLAGKPILSSSMSPKESEVIGSSPSQSQQQNEIIHETKAVYGYAIRKNDIKIVEGIDPKIEKLLNEHGIHDWQSLETADVDFLNTILKDKGYFHLDPKSWPYQAALAKQGKWEELKKFQSNI